MRHGLTGVLSLCVVCFFTPLKGSAAKIEGFRDCVETCYVKECGEVGIRCPTVTQKQMYRRKCHGYCRARMEHIQEQKRLRAFQRHLALVRAQASTHRRALLLKHKMWMQKRVLLHRMKLEYLRAKRARSSQTKMLLRRMQMAHEGQIDAMRQKLRTKEDFYEARSRMRQLQRKEYLRRIEGLHKRLKKATRENKPKEVEAMKMRIKVTKKKVHVVSKKGAVLKINFYKARVQRRQETVNYIKVATTRLKSEKAEAKKKRDQKKLEALAKRLGELAGRQAAVARKAELDKKKLKKAREVLTSFQTNSGTRAEIH